MSNWIKFNNNPKGLDTSDCLIRATASLLEIEWKEAYQRLTEIGIEIGRIPNAQGTYELLLEDLGYSKFEATGKPLTVNQLSKDTEGKALMAVSNEHAVFIKDGKYYDTWDSGRQRVLEYYMFKGEETD